MGGFSTVVGSHADYTRIEKDASVLLSDSNENTLNEYLSNVQSAGLISGGVVTDDGTGTGTFDISLVFGMVKKTDNEIYDPATQDGKLILCSFPADSWQLTTPNELAWVFADYSGGTPTLDISYTGLSAINYTTQFDVAAVFLDDFGVVKTVAFSESIYQANRRWSNRSREIDNVKRASGEMVGAPTVAPDLTFSITAGVLYYGISRITTLGFDTAGTDTFLYYYRDPTEPSGWTYTLASTNIDNTYYDDGTGTLAELTAGKYGIHWIYRVLDGSVVVVYGQDEYDTQLAAREEQPPSVLPDIAAQFSILVGKAIILKSATLITEMQSAFATTFEYTTPTTHNMLTAIQGGIVAERYHLTSAQHGVVTAGTRGSIIGITAGTTAQQLAPGTLQQILHMNAGATDFEWTSSINGGSASAGITMMGVRQGTAAAWTAANPTLASGEWGLETDTRRMKIGDGATAWNALAYTGVTQINGQATVTALANTVVVAHGLPTVPTVQSITLMPTDDIGGRTLWVDTIGAANFTIHMVPADVVNHVISWEV